MGERYDVVLINGGYFLAYANADTNYDTHLGRMDKTDIAKIEAMEAKHSIELKGLFQRIAKASVEAPVVTIQ